MTFSPDKFDYNRATNICQNWLENNYSADSCGGQNLINTFKNIATEMPAFCIIDKRPFGDLLSRIRGENILIVMKVLMAHINNPNFTLRSGFYKDKTLLQGVIATGNKELVKMLLSNSHGSKVHLIKEPLIIDYESMLWLIKEKLK